MPLPIPVRIVPPSPVWPELAQREIDRLAAALGPAISCVHHIGSTSVPGLAAKPILDLMPVTSDIRLIDGTLTVFGDLGYRCRGELGIPGRRYFTLEDGTGVRRAQLHCFQTGSPHIERHLAFRDYLRAHPAAAATYQAEKQRCAGLHPSDSHAYSDCKAGWITTAEAEALAWYRRTANVTGFPATAGTTRQ